jgi:hypothetical protein
MIKSREIDDRNQLHKVMRYQYTISLPLFFDVREWCWQHWGPGVEYEHYRNLFRSTGQIKRWAWDCTKWQGAAISSGKIYLPDDDDMHALFALTWCGQ